MPAAAPGVYSLALVRVHELRAQKSFATRQFDDMDEWMEDQEELGLQQTLTKLQVRHNSSRQQQTTQPAPASQQQIACCLCDALRPFVLGSTPPASSMGFCLQEFSGLSTPTHLLLSFPALLLLSLFACTAVAAGARRVKPVCHCVERIPRPEEQQQHEQAPGPDQPNLRRPLQCCRSA